MRSQLGFLSLLPFCLPRPFLSRTSGWRRRKNLGNSKSRTHTVSQFWWENENEAKLTEKRKRRRKLHEKKENRQARKGKELAKKNAQLFQVSFRQLNWPKWSREEILRSEARADFPQIDLESSNERDKNNTTEANSHDVWQSGLKRDKKGAKLAMSNQFWNCSPLPSETVAGHKSKKSFFVRIRFNSLDCLGRRGPRSNESQKKGRNRELFTPVNVSSTDVCNSNRVPYPRINLPNQRFFWPHRGGMIVRFDVIKTNFPLSASTCRPFQALWRPFLPRSVGSKECVSGKTSEGPLVP